MTPQQLRNSILQMAIEGKLTEQRAEDGNASELLKEIKAEKARLIAEKKIKKEKSLPEISENEILFEIPDNWIWAYVGDLFMHNTGKAMNSSVKKINKTGSIRKFITTSNVYWNKLELTNLKEMFFSDDELERCTITTGDILICEGGAYYGRTAIWNKDYDICFQNHVHRLRKYKNLINMFFYYIFYFYRNNGLMQSKGTAMPGLSSVVLHNTVIPLPPLAEQKRIVARLEEILPQVDEYEKAYNGLQELNKKFPDNLKNSLLQMAIEGKLVEQRAEDGNARDLLKEIQAEKAKLIAEKKIKKEKPLPEISEDEIPFEIPDNWVWCKLGAIGYLERGSGIKRADVLEKGLPCIRYGELYTTYKGSFSKVMSFTSQEIFDKSHKGHSNDIFMALTGENKIDIATAVEYVGKMEINK